MEKDAAFERRFQQVQVKEPSVDSTISILRGLKEKYENFHGVSISDNALVAAAQLSDRYITSRFLPDKAIDCVDEACASIRVQLDSQPEGKALNSALVHVPGILADSLVEIDELERRKLQLDVERTALSREKSTEANTKKLDQLDSEISDLEEKLRAKRARFEKVFVFFDLMWT